MAESWGLPLHLPLPKEPADSSYGGIDSNYGGAAWTDYGSAKGPKKQTGRQMLLRSSRTRVNCCPLIMSILLPWLFFALIYAGMASSLHYTNPLWAYAVVGGGAFVVICMLLSSLAHYRSARDMGIAQEPSWLIFFTFSLLLAFLVAVVAGDISYAKYTKPWFERTTLNIYRGVDPVIARGQQLMDAGMIHFMPGTTLQKNMSMGFQDGQLYCVAPITSGDEPPVTYDFWAIGKGCCKASAAGFDCSSTRHLHPQSMVGVRLMDNSEQQYYRLAVKQAEAAYGITAAHPLFLTWRATEEADDVSTLLSKAQALLVSWLLGYLSLQFVIVILAMLLYFKSSQ